MTSLRPSLESANDFSVGANGAVWILDTASAYGGWIIQKWNGTGWDTNADGLAVRIAVDPNGVPWIVAPTGAIYKRSGTSATSGTW